MNKTKHKIGKHGAIGFVTQDRSICVECKKPVDCEHINLKIVKHRKDQFPHVHCMDCSGSWSDPIRALSFLKSFKRIKGEK